MRKVQSQNLLDSRISYYSNLSCIHIIFQEKCTFGSLHVGEFRGVIVIYIDLASFVFVRVCGLHLRACRRLLQEVWVEWRNHKTAKPHTDCEPFLELSAE